MVKIVDVNLNQLKLLARGGGAFLSYETETFMDVYYVSQAPIIFRTRVSKDSQDNFFAFRQGLGETVQLSSPIKDSKQSEDIAELKRTVLRLERALKKKN